MILFARFFTPFLMPLPLGLFFILLGLIFVLLRLRKLAAAVLLGSVAVFLVFGSSLPARRLRSLERAYPPLRLEQLAEAERQQIKFVAVLGNTHVSDPGVPETGQLGPASLYRLIEGIRLHRELPDSWLVVSGGACPGDAAANAVLVGRTARQLGVDGGRLVLEDRPRDTAEEAKLLKPLLKDAPFILVTSAAHMPRAMRIFQNEGLRPIAAPTDFIVKDRQQLTSASFLPSAANLERSEQVVYEWLGSLWNGISPSPGQ